MGRDNGDEGGKKEVAELGDPSHSRLPVAVLRE